MRNQPGTKVNETTPSRSLHCSPGQKPIPARCNRSKGCRKATASGIGSPRVPRSRSRYRRPEPRRRANGYPREEIREPGKRSPKHRFGSRAQTIILPAECEPEIRTRKGCYICRAIDACRTTPWARQRPKRGNRFQTLPVDAPGYKNFLIKTYWAFVNLDYSQKISR